MSQNSEESRNTGKPNCYRKSIGRRRKVKVTLPCFSEGQKTCPSQKTLYVSIYATFSTFYYKNEKKIPFKRS